MLPIEESVPKIQHSLLIGHSGVMGHGGVSVAEQDILDPAGHNALGVHQIPNRFQNRFEIVFFRFSTHDQVEGLVNILSPAVQSFRHVLEGSQWRRTPNSKGNRQNQFTEP